MKKIKNMKVKKKNKKQKTGLKLDFVIKILSRYWPIDVPSFDRRPNQVDKAPTALDRKPSRGCNGPGANIDFFGANRALQ